MTLREYFKDLKNEWGKTNKKILLLQLACWLLFSTIPIIVLNYGFSSIIEKFETRFGVIFSLILIIYFGIKIILPSQMGDLVTGSFIKKIDNSRDLTIIFSILASLHILIPSFIYFYKIFLYDRAPDRSTK